MARRRSTSPLDIGRSIRRSARGLFRFASVLNTMGHLITLDPVRIAKHLARKQMLKLAAQSRAYKLDK